MKLGLAPIPRVACVARLAPMIALSAMLVGVIACARDEASAPNEAITPEGPPSSSGSNGPPATCSPTSPCNFTPPPVEEPALGPVSVRWLGASGFLVSHGGESVITAPLFTRPNGFTVTTGISVKADPSLVDAKLDATTLSAVRAVISGHAHYDHLLDVPTILQKAPQATLYANMSARNMLAAWAPDRPAKCDGKPAQSPTIARSRVVAMDDAMASSIDWSNCASKKPANAPLDGKWVNVPNSNMRVLGVCSEHPDQIGPVHFGEGDVEEEQCEPLSKMGDWKEGITIAFLIDFLNPKTKEPTFRIFYQDAPTNPPVGHVPPKFLLDRKVDLALLCVGSSNNVDDEPTSILSALTPRRAIGGHWEDFLRSIDDPPQPIPFLDVSKWEQKAKAIMTPTNDAPWSINGKTTNDRVVVPQPGDKYEIELR